METQEACKQKRMGGEKKWDHLTIARPRIVPRIVQKRKTNRDEGKDGWTIYEMKA